MNEWYFFYLSLFVVMFIFVMFHVCTYFNSFRTLVRITNNWKVERSRVMHIFLMNLKSFLVIIIHTLSEFIHTHWHFQCEQIFWNLRTYDPTCARKDSKAIQQVHIILVHTVRTFVCIIFFDVVRKFSLFFYRKYIFF